MEYTIVYCSEIKRNYLVKAKKSFVEINEEWRKYLTENKIDFSLQRKLNGLCDSVLEFYYINANTFKFLKQINIINENEILFHKVRNEQLYKLLDEKNWVIIWSKAVNYVIKDANITLVAYTPISC